MTFDPSPLTSLHPPNHAEDRRRYSFSPGAARQALNQMLNAEDDEIEDDEGDESLDIMAELQRPTNFFGKSLLTLLQRTAWRQSPWRCIIST